MLLIILLLLQVLTKPKPLEAKMDELWVAESVCGGWLWGRNRPNYSKTHGNRPMDISFISSSDMPVGPGDHASPICLLNPLFSKHISCLPFPKYLTFLSTFSSSFSLTIYCIPYSCTWFNSSYGKYGMERERERDRDTLITKLTMVRKILIKDYRNSGLLILIIMKFNKQQMLSSKRLLSLKYLDNYHHISPNSLTTFHSLFTQTNPISNDVFYS